MIGDFKQKFDTGGKDELVLGVVGDRSSEEAHVLVELPECLPRAVVWTGELDNRRQVRVVVRVDAKNNTVTVSVDGEGYLWDPDHAPALVVKFDGKTATATAVVEDLDADGAPTEEGAPAKEILLHTVTVEA